VLNGRYRVFKLPKPAMLKEVLRQITPDLFLLDYKMPEINGVELIPIIRSYQEHLSTPIIFLTSEATVDLASAVVAMGACDFVVKPFSSDVLHEKIARHIRF
jgi:DNA-binding response OmpR family regulator